MRVAVLLTVFNRIEKTLNCLKTLFEARVPDENLEFKIFITDDGSNDGTSEKLRETYFDKNIEILQGSGQLFWNGGMNNSWRAAINEGGFDGYLWLNNDSIILPNLWEELIAADQYSYETFKKGGIYVGSTYNKERTGLSYGGFVFTNRWTLKDKFLIPDGTFQNCEAAHGNITYVSSDVVESEGVFCDDYVHSGGDHDYSYLAFKHGFPVFILREYVGVCENDHYKSSAVIFKEMPLKKRLEYLKSPLGYNLNNTLLFQKRCFPYRYFPVLISGYAKAIFPGVYYGLLKKVRK